MQTVSPGKVVAPVGAVEEPLPPRTQVALRAALGAAKEGLVDAGLGVALGTPGGSMRMSRTAWNFGGGPGVM